MAKTKKELELMYKKAVELFNEEKYFQAQLAFKKLSTYNFDDTPFDFDGVYIYPLKRDLSNPKSIKCLEKISSYGFACAKELLGEAYCLGEYVQQNYDIAVNYLIGASRKNWYNATYNLACCYAKGNGVNKDYSMAFELMYKTANQQDETNYYDGAMYNVGYMYKMGLGVEKDIKKAIEYFMMAANFNNVDALEELIEICDKNKSALTKNKDFMEWFEEFISNTDDLLEDVLEKAEILEEKLG